MPQTFEVTCSECGELRWPYLSERPNTYVCVRCRSGVGAARREAGRKGGSSEKVSPQPATGSYKPRVAAAGRSFCYYRAGLFPLLHIDVLQKRWRRCQWGTRGLILEPVPVLAGFSENLRGVHVWAVARTVSILGAVASKTRARLRVTYPSWLAGFSVNQVARILESPARPCPD